MSATDANTSSTITIDQTRATMTAFLEAVIEGGPVWPYLALDATLSMMDTNTVTQGRDPVIALIGDLYGRALGAKLDIQSLVVEPGRAMLELVCAGTSPGDTEVRVPYAVACTLAGGVITSIRVYAPAKTAPRHPDGPGDVHRRANRR
jgi:hypothetical protein